MEGKDKGEGSSSAMMTVPEHPLDCPLEHDYHQAMAKNKDRLRELENEVTVLKNSIVAWCQHGDLNIVDVLRRRGFDLPKEWLAQRLVDQEKKQEEDPSEQERQEHYMEIPQEREQPRLSFVSSAIRVLTCCPAEASDQAPNTDHLRCTIERLEREKQRILQASDATTRDISKLRQELGRISHVANRNYKYWEGACRENHQLKQYIETLENGIENARRESKLANQRASNATEVQQRLYQLLESAVIKRKDKAGQLSFPSGDDILSSIRSSQKYAEDLFFDLVDLLIADCGMDSKPKDYFAMLSEVFTPLASMSRESHGAWVSLKKEQLGALVEDHNQLEKPLTSLFMSATMQRLVQKRQQQAHEEDERLELEDDTHGQEHPSLLQWTVSDEVEQDEEMDGRSVQSFFQELVHLYGACEFSDPPCYLYPPVGFAIPYSPEHHTQRISKTLSTKARPSDSVRVLYPGLYYENPEINPKAKPVQKALVLCFNEPSMTEK